MAKTIASGSAYASTYSYGTQSYLYETEVVENSQSIENNTTNVTVNFYITPKNSKFNGWADDDAKFEISSNNGQTFNNNSVLRSARPNCTTYNSRVLVVSWTGTFNNKTDGSLAITASITYGWVSNSTNYYTPKTTTVTANGNTTTIPRATTPTLSVTSAKMGDTLAISLPRASNTFTHKLTYSFASTSGTIGTDITTSKDWIIPKDLANSIPSATNGTLIISCATYNGETLIGSKSISLTLNISDDMLPVISLIKTSEAGTVHLGVYVQNYSKIKIDITSSGSYGSTVKSISTTFDGVTYTGASVTSGIQYISGEKQISVTVTDSRGKTATSTASVTILAYKPPKISAFTANRCDSEGNAKDDGQYAKISYAYSTTPLGNQNQISLKIKSGETSFIDQSPVAYEADTFLITNAVFDTEHSYAITITVIDEFNSNTATVILPTDITTFDILASGKGIAFGKVAETENLLDVKFNAKFSGDVYFKNDTDWTNLTLSTAFTYYDKQTDIPKYRVYGKQVEIRGTIKPTTTHMASNTRETIATLPSALAPSDAIFLLCQGSGKNTWLLSVQTDGEITFSRYGTSENAEVPNTAWLPFQITYLLD
ncbi:MAG: DUF859 family phage minor structural protein [Erysipelotrichia bacterium]|nr:DUF859 family phage minor structural protein [Erysipelotrichia bacterium]